MKILFIGSVEFSAGALRKLISIKAEIAGVCTLESSEFNSDFINLSHIAEANSIPYRYSPDINSKESLDWIKSLNPDVIFCFGWSRLLKTEILQLTKIGVVGYHPALLPQNRGRHPLIWAIALGLEETGSTFFFMDEGADSGPIISQKKLLIEDDDASSLYKKIQKIAFKQIEEFLPILSQDLIPARTQDNTKANYWRKRSQKDGLIDWRMTSGDIVNLVKALIKPYQGAHFVYNDSNITVWHCEVLKKDQNNIEPGKVLSIDNNEIVVKTGDGAVKLLEITPDVGINLGEYLN